MIKKSIIKRKSSLTSFFASALVGILFAGLFSTAMYVFATPPASQYSPGETLNPSCAVGSTNCSMTSPVPYSGATGAVDLGSQNLSTTGNGGFGALTGTLFTAINTSGAQEILKYNSTNYATLTTASNGDFTLATTSATTGGNININSAIGGDFTLLSNTGTLVFGGTSLSNNENLKLDFETYANKVAITSSSGVSELDLGAFNLTTTGTLTLGASTAGTLVTRVKAGAATESDSNGALVVDSSNGRLYFRYGGAWHYVAQTAGFQIPNFETVDPLSGDQIKQGDLVLGTVNQTFEDGALHGVWVRWDNVKQELIKELQGKISLALPQENSALTTEKLSAKTARIENLEMVDRATGEIYCTFIQNGEWQKAKGECGKDAVNSVATSSIDDAIQSGASALLDKAGVFIGFAANTITPKELKQFSAILWEQGKNVKDFITHKY